MTIKKEKKIILADLALLFVALLWGGGFVAVKEAVNHIPPFYLISIRFGASAILISLIYWKKLKEIQKEDLTIGILVGFFLFLGFAAQTSGAQFTSAGKSAFLTAVNVIIVPFAGWILYKNKLDSRTVIAAILCLIGIAFLTLRAEATMNIGDILTLACAIAFAIHITLLGNYAKKVDPIILSITQMLTTSILALICAILFEAFRELLAIKIAELHNSRPRTIVR